VNLVAQFPTHLLAPGGELFRFLRRHPLKVHVGALLYPGMRFLISLQFLEEGRDSYPEAIKQVLNLNSYMAVGKPGSLDNPLLDFGPPQPPGIEKASSCALFGQVLTAGERVEYSASGSVQIKPVAFNCLWDSRYLSTQLVKFSRTRPGSGFSAASQPAASIPTYKSVSVRRTSCLSKQSLLAATISAKSFRALSMHGNSLIRTALRRSSLS
jgi:hypothetical protein